MSHPLSLTVLLIDDCPEDRYLYRRFLQQDSLYTYRIVECVTATKALKWCQQEIPDIILLDYKLPDEDGLEVLEKLRQYFTNSQTSAILLTGHGNEMIAVRAMKSGCQDYLVKDQLTSNILHRAIHQAVERINLTRQLQQSQEKQQIITAAALRIRQSLKLEEVLQTTTIEVRQFLKADRVLVYQFNPDMSGTIVTESVLPNWRASLGTQIQDTCFQEGAGQDYHQGKKRAIDDIYQADLTDCHLQLLEQFQVKANLVVPIIVTGQLWGLLIAHQCSAPRHWEAQELELLDQLAVQIAIAIQQASAYQQVQAELAERQRIQKTLQENEENFHQLATAVEEVFLIQNADFSKTIYLSPGYERIWQRPCAEVYKNPMVWLESVYPEDISRLQTEMQQVISGQKCQAEYRIFRPSGELRWILVQAFPVFDDSGKVYRTIASAKDITERKQVAIALQALNQELETRVEQRTAALQASEERWQLILRGTNDGIWDWDTRTNQVFFSTRWKQMRGLSDDEISYNLEEWSSRIHPDDYEPVMQAVADHFAQKTPFFQEEYRVNHKDGSYLWILDRGQALWDDAGNVIRMSGSETDITESKQKKEQLRNLSDRLTLALQAGELGTWDWDMVQEAEWDDRMYELYGLQRSEIEATYENWRNVVHPDDLPEVEAALQAAIRGEKEYNREFRAVHPDGSIHFIRAAAVVQRNDQGEPIRMVGINYDITERKTIELALRESERRYAALTQAAPVGIFRFDTIGNCLYVNESWSQMTGRPTQAALGQGWIETLHPEDRDRLLQKWFQWSQTAQPGELFSNEGRHLLPDGSITWFYSCVIAEANANGRIIGYVGTLTDITERKQVETKVWETNEELNKVNAELAHATHLKDEFLANMSHELRTPLNAILGMSEALQDGLFGVINERQLKAISTIERSGRHLLELINDILDLSKIESGKLELDLSDVSVHSLCDSSFVFVRQMALKKNIALKSHIANNLVSLQVDERRMRQVLINLLNNAVKFTKENGSVSLTVRLEEPGEVESTATVSSALSSPFLCFSVTDTGIGINQDDISKLFQAFIQVNSSLSREYEGTGLGLALVKQIVELHEGTVSVSSEVGKGSCFTVRIPYRSSNENLTTKVNIPSPTEIELSPPSLKSPVILIVEDNQVNIDTIFDYLESRGYRLMTANNGQQALDIAANQRPDLILMDIQMPQMDGLEAIQRIRRDLQLVDVPIIALTALAMPGDRESCLAAGANEYLSKPVRLKQLAITIQQLLSK
ncbi:PAS domain-containing protein [Anabaena azotica]|uniref:PAS domain-containing protein n=1 Tax=Anabaena azotica TaxID=197653 RepID=UPI0039A51728